MSILISILVSALLSGLGGIMAGLGAGRLLGGSMTGGLLGGMIGAMAVHFTLYPVTEGVFPDSFSAFLQGAMGGAALGLAGAFMMRKKT